MGSMDRISEVGGPHSRIMENLSSTLEPWHMHLELRAGAGTT